VNKTLFDQIFCGDTIISAVSQIRKGYFKGNYRLKSHFLDFCALSYLQPLTMLWLAQVALQKPWNGDFPLFAHRKNFHTTTFHIFPSYLGARYGNQVDSERQIPAFSNLSK
jgi:hypothetical protein